MDKYFKNNQKETIPKHQVIYVDNDNQFGLIKKSMEDKDIKKGFNNRDIAFSEPVLSDFPLSSINPEYRSKPSGYGVDDIYQVLRRVSNNPIFQAILNVRSGQVGMFTRPINKSTNGTGYQVVLANHAKPTDFQQQMITKAEHFIQYMGVDDPSNINYKPRDNFEQFCNKIVRDTFTFDQVNAEKTFDRNGNLHHIKAVDPATIYKKVDKNTHKIIPNVYVQVAQNQIVHQFTNEDMIFAVRRPRTDIWSSGYGQSELEVAMREFQAEQNTEIFNDRFFSHGGSVQGILNIKSSADSAGAGISQRQLDSFRRMWTRRVTGLTGSWQIPVTTAEDVQYINMTPNARDIQFEKWMNFLINVCSSVFNIDSAEIGFPNQSGATGSKSRTMNEGDPKAKLQASMNRGLSPLLRFIENIINDEIITPYFGNTYAFQFIGEDISGEEDRADLITKQVQSYRTPNEIRNEHDLPPVKGGDIILNNFALNRIGQQNQEKAMERDWLMQKLQLLSNTTPASDNKQVSFQDVQSGLNGKTANGQDNSINNGQQRDQARTDKINYGGKSDE